MSTDIQKILKILQENKKELSKLQKENLEFKKILKTLCSKLDGINSKIAEFEIVFDAAEIIEEEREEAEKYNTEWNPYDDEDFEPESYEQYYNDDEDEDELPRGY